MSKEDILNFRLPSIRDLTGEDIIDVPAGTRLLFVDFAESRTRDSTTFKLTAGKVYEVVEESKVSAFSNRYYVVVTNDKGIKTGVWLRGFKHLEDDDSHA